MSKKDFLFFWKIALTIRNCCAIMPMFRIRRHSQAVRQRSAKPLFPGSNPGGASKTKKHFVRSAFFVLERCLPLRASDVAFGSDVHFVSDVSPCGEVGKHYITLRLGAIHHCALALHHCDEVATSLFTSAPKCAIIYLTQASNDRKAVGYGSCSI